MANKKIITREEFDRVMKLVEQKTCFRFQAVTDISSAFMIPVGKDNTAIGPTQEFTWKQLVAMSKLPDRPQ